MKSLSVLLATCLLGCCLCHDAWALEPSRKAMEGCAWEKLSDARLGLEAWVQRCQLGTRKIDLFVSGTSVVQRYSDGGRPEPVLDVLELRPNEKPESGIQRFFTAHTKKRIAVECVLAPAPTDAVKPRAGVQRYTFVPNKAYAKRLKATADPNDIPPPPCGEWGDQPDEVDYFEVQPSSSSAHKVLYIRYGQDEPLFDEQTLQLFPRP
jgi:hypothetical protein